ncbi:MAG: TonB-dependent receptor, partial [Candidatus Eisenbacteria bacterium]
QQPNLQDLYVSYRFLQHKIRTGGYFVGFGNPNLKPEQTTAYEVGVARQLGDKARIDVTAYYKDVKDLVEITNVPSFPNSFSSYRNRDFATIKGVDIGYTTRKVNNVSASINYSLSYAQGTGSVSNSQGNIAWTASDPPKQTAPLDFDQRHKLSLNMDWSLGKGQGMTWGKWHPFEDVGINLLYNVGSGTPYTPTGVYNEVTLANVNSSPIGPLNSRYGPWTSNLDLKASRGFNLGGTKLSASLLVLNVLNAKNANGVYTGTGSAFTTGWLNTEDGQSFISNTADKNGEALYNLSQNNPNIYSNPRLVRFGIRANF